MRTSSILMCLLLGFASVACSDDETRRNTTPPPSPRVPELLSSHDEDELHVQARWEMVTKLAGRGPTTTRAFAIADDAIQWRVVWECEGEGPIEIFPAGLADDREPLVQQDCPGTGEGLAIESGTQSLRIETAGGWTVAVEQQVDTPLYEPLLKSMRSPRAEIVSRNNFYDVELTGTGEVLLYRLPNGRSALRLEDFWITPNVDLEVWTSELEHPETSKQLVQSEHREIEFLRATAGSQNYVLPKDLKKDDVRSVAIWCELTHQIYVASEV